MSNKRTLSFGTKKLQVVKKYKTHQNSSMFDYLSIDWGTKYFGIAFGSSETGLVVAHQKVVHSEQIWEELEQILLEKNIEHIVLGIPTNFRLQPTANTHKVQEFKLELEQFLTNINKTITITLFNERQTTMNSTLNNRKLELKTNKSNIDNLSAMNLLKEYFRFNKI
jgi:putative transcription antitermination factor YqgF